MTVRPADYCPDCGTGTTTREIEGRERRYCESCERVLWQNPVPVANAAVVSESGVLLTERTVEPGIGKWSVPGGHLEMDESPAEAAARELREETGVRVAPERLTLLDTFAKDSIAGKRVVSIGFVVHRENTDGEPEPLHEVAEVGWFTPEAFAETDAEFLDPYGERVERAWNWLD